MIVCLISFHVIIVMRLRLPQRPEIEPRADFIRALLHRVVLVTQQALSADRLIDLMAITALLALLWLWHPSIQSTRVVTWKLDDLSYLHQYSHNWFRQREATTRDSWTVNPSRIET
jgi:hypothetical protein